MKKLTILVGICLFSLHCIGQNNKENFSNKKLSSKIIEIFKKNGKYENVINDSLYILTETETSYILTSKPIDKNFKRILYYRKNTLTISNEYLCFTDMYISTKKYDQKGNLSEKRDYNKGFENFSIIDLIETVKQELNIDLNENIEGLSISRYIINKIPIYHIYIYNKTSQMQRIVTINGNTRKIISDSSENIRAGD
ncbi:hypothetical protein [uncultured Flavobacterium sp.]|uniref:hypothetical protein n=1 Tax=uncultured Flavobacterium sp. TaxID=165435 RepID=UPI0025E33AF6|nr:hypothetical protein [uncultured Flavobacterium sp.]